MKETELERRFLGSLLATFGFLFDMLWKKSMAKNSILPNWVHKLSLVRLIAIRHAYFYTVYNINTWTSVRKPWALFRTNLWWYFPLPWNWESNRTKLLINEFFLNGFIHFRRIPGLQYNPWDVKVSEIIVVIMTLKLMITFSLMLCKSLKV